MNPPNLFQIATRELSQDAFVTWLLQWADPKYQELNAKLSACAQSFLRLLLAEDAKFPIKSVTAGRQWENIDIWAEINDEILLVVEDKTHTTEHSSQLEKYKATAEAWCKDPERGKPWQAKLAYLKTGDEAGGFLQEIRAKGYCTVDRRDFLNLLQSYKDVENDIFTDFRTNLARMEDDAANFQTKPLSAWNDSQWKGFYRWLEDQPEIPGKKWFKVNNAAGGFWGYVLNWQQHKNAYPIYLQIESHRGDLCLKMATHPDDTGMDDVSEDRGAVRNRYHNYLQKKAEKAGLPHLRRPDRFGNGNYMTVAVVDRENWLGGNDTLIQPADVLKKLVEYHEFVHKCAKEWASN